MSQHFLERGGLPPGLTSFTKIRLGWIAREQVRFIKPGETAVAFLSPLGAGGETLVVKIPLSWGNYYLVENRQPVGFDRALWRTLRAADLQAGSANLAHEVR